jgi:hypothetical protein
MPFVYIVQEPRRKNRETGEWVSAFDLTPAAEHGELQFLLPSGPVMLNPQPMINKLRMKLCNFTDDDYILPVGDPVAIVAATAVAASFNRNQVALLKWESRRGCYQIIRANFNGKEYQRVCA